MNICVPLSTECLSDATLLHASRTLFLVVINTAVRHSSSCGSSSFGRHDHRETKLVWWGDYWNVPGQRVWCRLATGKCCPESLHLLAGDGDTFAAVSATVIHRLNEERSSAKKNLKRKLHSYHETLTNLLHHRRSSTGR
jgi:hypothetical protein